jgi:prevent-host-death family protein
VFVSDHDPNLKGNVAEACIAAAAIKLRVPVLRPLTEHCRYDLAFEIRDRLLRVQCKWAPVQDDVIKVKLTASRYAASGQQIRTVYSASEIDAIAIYCEELDASYLVPIELVAGRTAIWLRLSPAKNQQRACLNWAADYELAGAIAQLGERRYGIPKVAGSSPASSTSGGPSELGAHEYRQKFGWYMERAAAGESFLVTRRGKPYARLSPPVEQLDLPAPEPGEVVPIAEAKERRA